MNKTDYSSVKVGFFLFFLKGAYTNYYLVYTYLSEESIFIQL